MRSWKALLQGFCREASASGQALLAVSSCHRRLLLFPTVSWFPWPRFLGQGWILPHTSLLFTPPRAVGFRLRRHRIDMMELVPCYPCFMLGQENLAARPQRLAA